jgi:hypothetical protein
MDNNFFVQKREFEALQRTLSQTKSLLTSALSNQKKLQKQTMLYSNQFKIIIAELNNTIQKLSRDKMLAESTKNINNKIKAESQIEIITSMRNMILQKISYIK